MSGQASFYLENEREDRRGGVERGERLFLNVKQGADGGGGGRKCCPAHTAGGMANTCIVHKARVSDKTTSDDNLSIVCRPRPFNGGFLICHH